MGRMEAQAAMDRYINSKIEMNIAMGAMDSALNEYFCDLYGLKIGDKVLKKDTLHNVKLERFVPVAWNLDLRPDIVGKIIRPYGIDEKSRKIKSDNWIYVGEEENGNLRT